MGRRRGRRGAIAGTLLAFVGAYWVGLGSAQLGHVWITRVGSVDRTLAPTPSWAVLTAMTAAGLALLTGPRAWVGRVDPVSLVGGVWTLGWLAMFSDFKSNWELTGTAHCVYASCWPRGWQELAVAAPLGIGCLALVVMVAFGRRVPRWVRAAVPASLFVVLAVVQVAIWDGVIIPVLNGPPLSLF